MSTGGPPKIFDIIIIGAGPSGLFGAFYAGMRELSCLLLAVLPLPGGGAGWAIRTDKAEHHGRAVVIAAGIGAFRPMKLQNESIDRFEGRGVEYFVTDLNTYAGQRGMVGGGGDSAVDWALAIEPTAEQVILSHPREGFRAHDLSVNQLKHSGDGVRLCYELREQQGTDRLERA